MLTCTASRRKAAEIALPKHSCNGRDMGKDHKLSQGSTFFGAGGTSSEEELPPKRAPSGLQSPSLVSFPSAEDWDQGGG